MLTFEEYRKKKEVERKTKFVRKEEKKIKKNEAVKVQVGLVHQIDGQLRKVKGRTIPVQLQPSCDARTLLSTSVEKHANRYLEYVILYPDMSSVCFSPGNLNPFSLEAYKNDLLKPYSKLYFWLCEKK